MKFIKGIDFNKISGKVFVIAWFCDGTYKTETFKDINKAEEYRKIIGDKFIEQQNFLTKQNEKE